METKKFVVELLSDIMSAISGKEKKSKPKLSTDTTQTIIEKAQALKDKPYRKANK